MLLDPKSVEAGDDPCDVLLACKGLWRVNRRSDQPLMDRVALHPHSMGLSPGSLLASAKAVAVSSTDVGVYLVNLWSKPVTATRLVGDAKREFVRGAVSHSASPSGELTA